MLLKQVATQLGETVLLLPLLCSLEALFLLLLEILRGDFLLVTGGTVALGGGGGGGS